MYYIEYQIYEDYFTLVKQIVYNCKAFLLHL